MKKLTVLIIVLNQNVVVENVFYCFILRSISWDILNFCIEMAFIFSTTVLLCLFVQNTYIINQQKLNKFFLPPFIYRYSFLSLISVIAISNPLLYVYREII